MNIVQIIRESTAPHHDHTALVEGQASITYGALWERVDELAAQLTQAGVRRAMRVAFHSHDGIDYVAAALALLQLDAAIVPVPDTLTDDEIHQTLRRMDVHGLLRHRDMARQEDASSPDDSRPVGDVFTWRLRQAQGLLDDRCAALHAAFIRFSSGTTGQSKGVLLSHQSILERTTAADAGLRVTHEDVILWVLGMSHHFVVSILLFLRRAATIIVAHRQFPFSVLEAAKAHPITLIYGSPVHYFLLGASDAVAPDALKHVRLAVSTAMKMPRSIAQTFEEKFGFRASEAYGIIEIGLPFIDLQGDAATGSVGRPLPAYELRIDRPDAQGVGDVLIRGQGMFDAYVSPWRLRDQCLRDGWFATGDLGRLDDEGRLTLLGRTKTVIVCAGMKVFPEEVEEVINTMPGVAASRVSGQPHAQFGQVPHAEVELQADVTDAPALLGRLRGHCLGRLSSYKVPVTFEAVSSLPRTPSGKVQRHAPAREA